MVPSQSRHEFTGHRLDVSEQPGRCRALPAFRTTATVANRSGKIIQITLTVSWRNYAGHTHQRSLTTYYGNGGLHPDFTTQA